MPIPAADLEQAKAGPGAADLIQQIIQLPLDSLLQRSIGRQIFTIRKIPNPDRLSRVYERVTKLHQLRRRHTARRLRKHNSIGSLSPRTRSRDTLAALDYRHEFSPLAGFLAIVPIATLLLPGEWMARRCPRLSSGAETLIPPGAYQRSRKASFSIAFLAILSRQ